MPKIRKSTSLKAAAVALGVAGIVGLTISSAASLNLTGGNLGAGTSVVAACQTSGSITVSLTTTYSASTPGYTVTGVNLGSVPAACAGQSVKVTLQGASNASLAEITGTATATTTTLTVPGNIPATSVVGTAVVIYN